MERLFIDTTAFMALYDRSDRYHASTIRYWRSLREKRVKLWTSEYILDETLTLIRKRVGHGEAVAFGNSIRTGKTDVLEVTRDIRDTAWEIFVRYSDKDFSFTDCTSFALMRQIAVKKAFSFDRHFAQFGLEVVP